MAVRLVIDGLNPWDGSYELDLDATEFTTREWGWIKRHAGYLPLTVEEGFRGGDPELFAVMAAIALHRAGRIQPADVADLLERVGDAPFGTTITLADDQQQEPGGDAGPPAPSSSLSGNASGDASPPSSATSPTVRNGSGTPGSVSSGSRPARSVT